MSDSRSNSEKRSSSSKSNRKDSSKSNDSRKNSHKSRSEIKEAINPGNVIYVTNLSLNTSEKKFHESFEKFGPIVSSKLIKDPYT